VRDEERVVESLQKALMKRSSSTSLFRILFGTANTLLHPHVAKLNALTTCVHHTKVLGRPFVAWISEDFFGGQQLALSLAVACSHHDLQGALCLAFWKEWRET
jgi:hypothetical protein